MPNQHDRAANRVLDIRTYRTVTGERDELLRIMTDGSVPMLRRFGIDVVAFGPSLHDEEHSFLIRSFASVAERDEQLERFYGSDEWVTTYDKLVMALLDSYHVVVVEASPDVVAALATLPPPAGYSGVSEHC